MTRRINIALTASILLLTFILSAGQAPAESILPLTNEEQSYLKTKDKLTIVCDPHWPPYEYIAEDGQYKGLSIDYHTLLSQRIGIPIVQLKTSSWSESIHFAKNGKCDLVSSLNKTPRRNRFLDFTDPFLKAKVGIVGKTTPHSDNLEDYAGETFSVVKGYKMEEDLRRDYPKIRRYQVNTTEESLQAIVDGKASATLTTIIEAKHFIQKRFSALTVLEITRYENNHRLGVRKGDAILLSIMQKAIASLTEADKRMIENKWIATQKERPDVQLGAKIPIVVGGLVLILLVVWLVGSRAKQKPTE